MSADIGRRLVAEGHQRVNFAIVGSGPNSASPHHDAGSRRIGPDEAVVCDFGGTMHGYCSDITRTVFTGRPARRVRRPLRRCSRAPRPPPWPRPGSGPPARRSTPPPAAPITDAGFGDAFLHRTGHGIGLEEHEDPYIVAGNDVALVAGHAFSVEPGIYLAGRFGARIEDIVVAAPDGPRALNQADHSLTVVDA